MRIGRRLDQLLRTPPPRPAETSHSAESAASAAAPTVDGADAGDDPQGGLSAHLVNVEANGAAVPDQPAEGGDVEAPAEAITEIEESLFETSVGEETPTEAAPEPEIAEPAMADTAEAAVEADPDAVSATRLPRQSLPPWRARSPRVRVSTSDDEPPEGFMIKGNERSMKYHVPESSGLRSTPSPRSGSTAKKRPRKPVSFARNARLILGQSSAAALGTISCVIRSIGGQLSAVGESSFSRRR